MPITTEDQAKLDAVLERNRRRPELLIQVLQDMQGQLRYLPEDALRYIAEQLGVPLPRVFHVATFYKAFSLRPRGKHVINVCRGTACHVRGSERLVSTVERELRIHDGQTTADLEFTLECVNCVGACALAPVLVIDGTTHGKVTPDRLRKILDGYRPAKAPESEETEEVAQAAPAPAPTAPAEAPKEAPAAQPSPAAPRAAEAEPSAAQAEPEAAVAEATPAASEPIPKGPGKKARRIERRIQRKAKKGGRKS